MMAARAAWQLRRCWHAANPPLLLPCLPLFPWPAALVVNVQVPAGTVLLVTAELETVEPRKVWMRASVSDGGRNTFATGRALFVAPNLAKLFGLNKWRDAGKQVAVAGPGPTAAVA